MNKVIRISQRELNEMVYRTVNDILNEEMEESWLSDKWGQTKSALGTVFGDNTSKTIKDRFNDAQKNWNLQGELYGLNNLMQQLTQFVENGQIDPNKTIGQLIGGKYNKGRFGNLNSRIYNRRNQITNNGGKFYE